MIINPDEAIPAVDGGSSDQSNLRRKILLSLHCFFFLSQLCYALSIASIAHRSGHSQSGN